MRVEAVIAVLCLVSASRSTAAAPSDAETCKADMSAAKLKVRPEFLLFGDSLTQRSFEEGGWGGRLTNDYVRKVDVVNRGLSGYNSRWAKHLLPRILKSRSQPPVLLTIWFGANDAVLPDRLKARQYVPIPEYRNTLEGMIQTARASGIEHILLITPPPVDEAARIRWNQQADGVSEATSIPERTNTNTQKYAEACLEAAKAQNVPVLDMFTQLPSKDVPNWSQLWFNDGLHFTSEGQSRVFQLVSQAIASKFADLRIDALPDDFPHHSLVDESNPETSLAGY